jgi:FkbM family methyltransferase
LKNNKLQGAGYFENLAAKAAVQPLDQIDSSRPVWIFGAGNFGQSVARVMLEHRLDVAGFVETAPKTNEILGLPVLDWATLARKNQDAQLVLGIFNRGVPFDQLAAIAKKNGFSSPVMPWASYDQFGKALGWRYWLSARKFLLENLHRLSKVAEILADDESRRILERLCAFRLGLDLEFASFQSQGNQYFNSLTLPSLRGKVITYVDCGAYNGDTYIELVNSPEVSCKQAYLMEPDPNNFDKLVRSLDKNDVRAICLPIAAAEKYEILTFSSGQGEGGAIGLGGDIHVAAVALDQMLPATQVDLLKIDVEGAEASLLRGARKMIQRSRPVIAMSLYHNPQDLWELPELISSICADYEIYVRQHFYNSFDCVIYAVPK